MKSILLSEVLTSEQMHNVSAILEKNKDSSDELLSELKRYFLEIKNDLEKQEIFSDYLAWAVYAEVTK